MRRGELQYPLTRRTVAALATALGLEVIRIPIQTTEDVETALTTAKAEKADGLMVVPQRGPDPALVDRAGR